MVIRLFYLALGSLGLLLAIVALILPVIPATPFLLTALVGFSRGSPRAHQILINLPFIQPLYKSLQEAGTFSVRQKVILSLFTLPMAILPFFLVENQFVHLTALAISAFSIFLVWSYRQSVVVES